MIINAILRGLKAAVDAVAKAIAWLLIALGLWVPLIYTLIFLIVVVFTGVPLEKTGTIYFLGLFLSFIGALWFSLAISARKGRKRKKKKESYNITDVKKKKKDKEEKPEDPPQIETEAENRQTEQQGENQMKDPYNNQQRQFNNDNEPYRDDGNDYRFQQPLSRNDWDQQNRNYEPRRSEPEPYNDPNTRSTYDNGDRKTWLSENPYLQQNNNYDSRSDQGGRPNWLHETEQNYEPRRKPTFEPYNTDSKQNQNYGQKPAFEPYNNAPRDRSDEDNNFNQQTFNRDRRRASFEPYNEPPRTQFEQNYGRNDSLGQNDNPNRSDLDFNRGRRSFDSYSDPQRSNNNDTFDRPQRYNDAPYNSQRYNDAPYGGTQRYSENNPYNGQAYDQRQPGRYDGGYGRGTNAEPPRRDDRNVPPPQSSSQGNYYNNGGYNGYNNPAPMAPENQGANNPPPRNPYETPRIFRLREDPDMLVYEYSDRLDYYKRTPYGNVYVRTKMK